MDKIIIKNASIAQYNYIKNTQTEILERLSLKSIEMDIPKKEYENIIHFSDRKHFKFMQRIEGVIMEDYHNIYVIFMATNRLRDWLTNLNFFKKSMPTKVNKKIKVHRGYLNRYTLDQVRTKILIKIAESNKKNVIITGYSMGGGLAPICALDVSTNFPEKKVHCVAMAGPRVGNKAFADKVNNETDEVNLMYGNDIVTKVPPKIFGFKHITTKHYGPKRKFCKLSTKQHMPHYLFSEIWKELEEE